MCLLRRFDGRLYRREELPLRTLTVIEMVQQMGRTLAKIRNSRPEIVLNDNAEEPTGALIIAVLRVGETYPVRRTLTVACRLQELNVFEQLSERAVFQSCTNICRDTVWRS